MTWHGERDMPPYTDQVERDAYRAGYSDGYLNFPRMNGDWPVNPYSKGYWNGKADVNSRKIS